MAMTDLNELLERVKKATGPDRELDSNIGFALGWYAQGYNFYAWVEADGTFIESVNPKPFTASIDATLALVGRLLPEWVVADLCQNSRHAGDPWGCTLAVYYGSTPSKNRSAQSGYDFPTAPLAILAALLSALIAKESQS